MRLLPIGCALLALASCHSQSKRQEPTASNEVSNQAASQSGGPIFKAADRTHKGQPAPAITFNDPDGKPVSLAAFNGKPTLVNLWASWCAPCVKELPTLDKLAQAQKGKLNVVAISQDSGPHPSVVAFLQSHHVALASYQDPKMGLSGALGAEVLPTSVLFDAQGREVWRYVGDQDWTSAAAAKLLSEAGA